MQRGALAVVAYACGVLAVALIVTLAGPELTIDLLSVLAASGQRLGQWVSWNSVQEGTVSG